MICVTGNIRHTSLRSLEQRAADITEAEAARRMLDLLDEAGIKVTFFVTGRCVEEEWDDVKLLSRNPLVEVGGHTYSGLRPVWRRRCSRALGMGYLGPAWLQRREIARTCRVIRSKSGREVRCWRGFDWRHETKTAVALASCDIQVFSDTVERNASGPRRHPAGLWSFPVNVMPDRGHLYYGPYKPESVENQVRRSGRFDEYGPNVYHAATWTDLVLREIHQHERNGVVSNLAIHPLALYLADGFQSFEKLVAYLERRQTVHMSEAMRKVVSSEPFDPFARSPVGSPSP